MQGRVRDRVRLSARHWSSLTRVADNRASMFEALTHRRYLVPFNAARLPQQFTDVLVIGGGVAGLRAAIAAAEGGAEVLVVTKDTVAESNTWYAQGGIAAVLQPLDSYQLHVEDTEKAGAGLCDE